MQEYRQAFDTLLGVKNQANQHELELFERAKMYIDKLSWIPGIKMIAIVNSLSMYATHEDSDIDLCIVTEKGMIWLARFLVTLTLWRYGVWRHGEDIAGNFCLSFYVTIESLDMEKIRISKDIYLYYWVYYMKPILDKRNTYEKFLHANSWVEIDEEQKDRNLKFLLPKIDDTKGQNILLRGIYGFCNSIVRFFLYPRTLSTYERLWEPEGVIISDMMLKFHDKDRRKEIREKILQKNFDK